MSNGNIKFSTVTADGISVFYRSTGDPANPTLLLLHGFPNSSHYYRNLMPLLASKYHVIAPDMPGFGFTTVPKERNYTYTFATLSHTIEAFLDVLNIQKYAVYIFDYGAPVALRIALRQPEKVTAIVSQNGNAYIEGIGPIFWAPVQKYWQSGSDEDRVALIPKLLSLEATKWQYEYGSVNVAAVAPENYYLDYALMCREGNEKIQLDLFGDYKSNLELYPQFQEYFRTSKVPVLAVWGKHDMIFVPEGAEGFVKDVKGVEVHLLDAGHMAAESNTEEIAGLMVDFLGRVLK